MFFAPAANGGNGTKRGIGREEGREEGREDGERGQREKEVLIYL